MPSATKRRDIKMIVTREDIKNGVAGNPAACGLHNTGARRLGVIDFNVTVDDSDPTNMRVWADWQESRGGEIFNCDAEITPQKDALSVVLANDTGKARLLRSWPKNGKVLILTSVRSRRSRGGVRIKADDELTAEELVIRNARRAALSVARDKLAAQRSDGTTKKHKPRRSRSRFIVGA